MKNNNVKENLPVHVTHSASAHTGCECLVTLKFGPPQGNSTETTLALDVTGGGQELEVETSDEGLRVTLKIFGDWEKEGLLTCLASALKAGGYNGR